MYLKSIKLFQFKNYEEKTLKFSPHMNCLVGKNGVGKTNLLDAIHYLCLTRSAFNTIEQQNVLHGTSFFMIQGEMEKSTKDYTLLCSYQNGKKKVFKVNQVDYERFSEHIGRFPIVLVAPTDTDLVREGSETRRKFMDSLIAQTDRQYLQNLLKYTKILKQRNALLKQFSERNYFDPDLLASFDNSLIELSKSIGNVRTKVTEEFIPLFQQFYQKLVREKESVKMRYRTKVLNDNFAESFKENLPKERILERTLSGIHKDDYLFSIEDYPLKKFGSQGQQKSFIIALKLAQYEFMKAKIGLSPILLLDDIFDKLDDERIAQLLSILSQQDFGQVFITDARPERSQQFFENMGPAAKIYQMD